jgi:predicted alpha/beta superfamily hydrolase
MSFAMTFDIVRWLSWGKEIPDVAIVGIAYGKTQADWWQKRSRDFTTCKDKTELWGKWEYAGGGDNFIKFIENELFPYIENKYQLKSPNRTIIGLSFGGLISADILFSKTELFKSYILAGPALQWNDGAIFKREEMYAQKNRLLNVIVYTSVGSLDDKTILEPWMKFNNQITNRKYESSIYKTDIIENETHLSMFPTALTKGLKFVLNQPKH